MTNLLRKSILAGASVVALSLLASSAQAAVLPVQNLTFSIYSGQAPKNNFSAVNPANWYRGPAANNSDLVFIDAPGTATTAISNVYTPNGYAVWGPFANPPSGGNFVQADGNPDFESEFKQDLTGLVSGTTYTLSFWQAAGQQFGFNGPTTEMWKVFLGNDPVTLTGPVAGNYGVNFGTNSAADSPLMNTPSNGVSPWQQVTVSLLATSANETLTFLAWGDGGSNINLPPTLFLAGVNTPDRNAPEPASLAIFGVALLGFGWLMFRRRSKNTPVV
jgi:hypothetical protein